MEPAGGFWGAEGGILGLLRRDPALMTPPGIVDAPASSAGLIFHHPVLLLSISRGLIVVSSNDSYYLHPLWTPEPGQHVILRAEHLPIAGGTCAHGDDLGSTVGAIARLFRPLERRVKPAPGPSCASVPPLNVCCCPGWAAQGVSAWAGDPKESLGCGVRPVLRWVGWGKGDTGRLCCDSPNWARFPSQLSFLGGSAVSGEPTPSLLQAFLSALQVKRDAWRTMKYMELFIVADNTLVSATGGRNLVPCRKKIKIKKTKNRSPLCSLPCSCSADLPPSPPLRSSGTRTSTWASPSSESWRLQTTWTR